MAVSNSADTRGQGPVGGLWTNAASWNDIDQEEPGCV